VNLLHLTQRPPKCTRLTKHPSQNVHLHSAPIGVTGSMKIWRQTGHSRAPCPLRMQRTMAGVPSRRRTDEVTDASPPTCCCCCPGTLACSRVLSSALRPARPRPRAPSICCRAWPFPASFAGPGSFGSPNSAPLTPAPVSCSLAGAGGGDSQCAHGGGGAAANGGGGAAAGGLLLGPTRPWTEGAPKLSPVHGRNSQKVNCLVHLLHTIAVQSPFEKFYQCRVRRESTLPPAEAIGWACTDARRHSRACACASEHGMFSSAKVCAAARLQIQVLGHVCMYIHTYYVLTKPPMPIIHTYVCVCVYYVLISPIRIHIQECVHTHIHTQHRVDLSSLACSLACCLCCCSFCLCCSSYSALSSSCDRSLCCCCCSLCCCCCCCCCFSSRSLLRCRSLSTRAVLMCVCAGKGVGGRGWVGGW
jgi:hypothetical protein